MTVDALDRQGVTRPPTRDLGIMVVALLAVSTSGPLIAATAAPALAIAFWRNAMGGGVLLPVALVRNRAELRGLSSRERALALLAGLLLALHFATWIPSIRYTSVASATALVATQPIWSALIGKARGERVGRQVWVGIVVSLSGALLLTGADLQVSGKALLGDGLALLGGLFAAAYMTAGSEVRRSVSTTTYTAVCYSTTALLLLVACLVGRQRLSGYDSSDWVKLVALTAGAQLLGHSLFNVVLRTTSPTVVSLSILFEIPGAALVAALFVSGQHVPWLAVPSAALLVTGLAIVIRSGSRTTEPSVPVE
ncbi:MAG: family transporter [Frankiales bacterium]|nr:family transporter [Frankiales bacterium]MCW2706525.1 family transporter [Frankiales bacterium]